MGDGLKKFAMMMRRYAAANPRQSSEMDISPYRITLSGGLRIVFYVDLYHMWYLSVYRDGTEPSSNEVKRVRADFGAPSEAKEERRVVGQRWHVISLSWPETEQKPLFEVKAKNEPNYYAFECGEAE